MPESMMQPDLQDVAPAKSCAGGGTGDGRSVVGRGQKMKHGGSPDWPRWINYRCGLADASLANGSGDLPTDTLVAGAHVIHFHNGMLVADSVDKMPKGISARPLMRMI